MLPHLYQMNGSEARKKVKLFFETLAEYSCKIFLMLGRQVSGQNGQTVNLLADAFGGSNPSLPTRKHNNGVSNPVTCNLIEKVSVEQLPQELSKTWFSIGDIFPCNLQTVKKDELGLVRLRNILVNRCRTQKDGAS